MTDFKIQKTVSLVPTETNLLSDGVDTCIEINSNIDISLSSYQDEDFGTTASKIIYQTGITVTGTTLDALVTDLGPTDTIRWMFIKLTSDSTSGAECIFKLGSTGTTYAGLQGVGDSFMGHIDDSQQAYSIQAQNITASVATGTPVMEVLIVRW